MPTPARARAAARTTALAVIGAIAVGLGVIGFVAANWDGDEPQPSGSRCSRPLSQARTRARYQLRERTGSRPRVGEALYLLGVLLFGASLFLVGQMYNVQAHDPLALLLWAGGATATALVVRSRAIAATAVLIFTGWIGFEFGLALDDAGGDAFAAFPVVAVFYGGALYGLATPRAGADPRALVREQRFRRVRPRRRAAGRGRAGSSSSRSRRRPTSSPRRADGLDGAVLAGFVLLAALALRRGRRTRALAPAERPLRGGRARSPCSRRCSSR